MSDAPPFPLPAPDSKPLRGMYFDFQRLFASELWALASPEEIGAAFALWGRSLQQIPPGSLPDDERALAAFSGAGKNWRRVRAMALHGFVKYGDRLYHKVVCEFVLSAQGKMQASRAQTANAREARNRERNNVSNRGSDNVSDNDRNRGSNNKRNNQRNNVSNRHQEQEQESSSISNEIAAAGHAREARPAAAAVEKMKDLNGFHFLDGIAGQWNQRAENYGSPQVVELTDRRAKQTRTMLDAIREHGFASDDAAFGFILAKLDQSFFCHNPKRPLTFDQLVSENFWPQLIEGAFEYRPQKRGRP
jgi:uncharacterized protein YdaU (DUF1376 family)